MSDLTAPLQESPHDRAVKEFQRMADRVSKNTSGEFAGAFVIVDPDGVVKTLLLLNDAPNAAMFWSNAETACKIAQAELDSGNPMNPRQPNWGR